MFVVCYFAISTKKDTVATSPKRSATMSFLQMCFQGNSSKFTLILQHLSNRCDIMSHMHPVKIVIVEDELPIQRLYKTKLELEGFGVEVASTGSEGLKLIRQTTPDLVLLDLRMPGMNGDEMLVKLRQTEWGAGVRVIILTNVSRDEAPAQLRLLGVSRYIVKAHHTPSQLVEIIHEVLGDVSRRHKL